jgi:UDP-GlcNAc:undecaprenyl-phosphate GlcNAc-1-phosphate transferase
MALAARATQDARQPQKMKAFLALFFAAAALSAAMTPPIRSLAIRLRALSRPGGRNLNERAVPRMGGVAVAIGTLAPLALVAMVHSSVGASLRADALQLLGLVAGGVFLCGVGTLDDVRRLRAIHKLALQVAAAVIAFSCGYRIEAVRLPLIGELSMGVFALPVTTLWVVGVTNAINLIDGLDGLAAGVAFFAGLTNFVVAYVNGSIFVAAVMAAMLGAVVGFLVFNFNPARIFMGDSGSYFLGYVLGSVSLAGSSQKASTAVSVLVPLVALGLPIVDMLFTIARRFLEKRSIFSPDRGHIHHRLLDMGLTHRRAVLLLYGVCLVLTAAAIGISLGRSWQVGLALLCATLVVVTISRFVGYFEYLLLLRGQHPRAWDRHSRLLRDAMPEMARRLSEARSEPDVFAALEQLTALAQLDSANIVPVDVDAKVSVQPPAEIDERVALLFAIGPDATAQSAICFRWRPEDGRVSPQAETLLQIVADLAASVLSRVGSRHAPLAARAVQPEAAMVDERVDVTDPA